MLVQEQQLPRVDAASPFDWGIAFVLTKWREIFVISFVAALAQVGLNFVEFFTSVDYKQLFLLAVVAVIINCWVIVTVMLMAVSSILGLRNGLLELSGKAFLAMPKVMLSYFMLLSLIVVFINLAAEFVRRPVLWPFTLILFLIPLFLFWAPIFCAAEVAVKAPERKADEDDDLDDDEDDLVLRIQRTSLKLFAERPVWDLGFARSVGFSNYVPLLTAQVAILLWIASITPMGFVTMLAGYYFGFEWIVVKVLLGSLFFTIVVAIACAAFLFVLPKEAVSEFGIVPQQSEDLARIEPLRKRIGFRRRLLPFLLLVSLGFVCTYFSALWAKHQRVMPSTAKVKLENVELSDEQLVLSLYLEDSAYEFRWLSTEAMRLRVERADDKEKSQEKNKSKDGKPEDAPVPDMSTIFSGEEEAQSGLLVPQRVLPFTPEGAPLAEGDFTPRRGPLRLKLYFANPLRTGENDLPFELFHPSMFELGTPLVKGVIHAPVNFKKTKETPAI